MACCLMAPSHYLMNQYWFYMIKVLWHSQDQFHTFVPKLIFSIIGLKITFVKLGPTLPRVNDSPLSPSSFSTKNQSQFLHHICGDEAACLMPPPTNVPMLPLRDYKCHTCPSSFPSMTALQEHLHTHGESTYTCLNCGRVFTSNGDLTQHVADCATT